MRPLRFFIHVLVVLGLFSVSAAADGKRVALVIGNGAYKTVDGLANPRNDADDIAEVFRALGMTVVEGTDLDRSGMENKIREFADGLPGADAAIFFYSGHGLQVNGVNYLVPVDAELTSPTSLDFEMVRFDSVQTLMEANVKTNILFLDACRTNPFERKIARALGTRAVSLGKGLAPVESGVGTLISFATQPGNVALDGSGRNSPFTGALKLALASPDEDILSELTSVRNAVLAVTNGQQVPWENHALLAKFYFNTLHVPAVSRASPEEDEVSKAWALIQDSGDAAVLQAFRKQFGAANPFYDTLAAGRIAKLQPAPTETVPQVGPPADNRDITVTAPMTQGDNPVSSTIIEKSAPTTDDSGSYVFGEEPILPKVHTVSTDSDTDCHPRELHCLSVAARLSITSQSSSFQCQEACEMAAEKCISDRTFVFPTSCRRN